MTTVHAGKYVACPFSASIEYAENTLRERRELVVSPGPALGERVQMDAKATDDLTDSVRRHDALLLAWQPKHTTMFPDFHGALTVRPKLSGSYLRLQGSYDPPAGVVGRAFDAIFGRAIATLTMRRLLNEIGKSVERQWTAFRKELEA